MSFGFLTVFDAGTTPSDSSGNASIVEVVVSDVSIFAASPFAGSAPEETSASTLSVYAVSPHVHGGIGENVVGQSSERSEFSGIHIFSWQWNLLAMCRV